MGVNVCFNLKGRNRGGEGEGEWSVNIIGFVFCDDAVPGNVDISNKN